MGLIHRYILIFCLVICIGCTEKTNSSKSIDHAISSAIIAKLMLPTSDIVVIPNTPKIGDKCSQCNDPPGTCGPGKIGDGVICTKCPTCSGDGKIDEQDLPKQFSQAYIINMYSRDFCSWCEKWKKEIQPELEKAGYIINIIDDYGTVPRFEIINNDKKYNYSGFMSLEKFKEITNNDRNH